MQDATTIWSAIGLIISGLLGGGLVFKKAGISITLSRSTEKQGDKTIMPNGNGERSKVASQEAIDLFKELAEKKQDEKTCLLMHKQLKEDISEIKADLKAMHDVGTMVTAIYHHLDLG